MRLRTTLTSALAFSALITAPAASAATQTVSVSSSSGNPALSPGIVFLDLGDTVTIDYPTATPTPPSLTITGTCPALGGAISQTVANGGSWTSPASTSSQDCNLTIAITSTSLLQVLFNSPTPPPGPTPSSDASGSSAPAPVIQQFGLPFTGTCDEAQPEGLNLSGVASGGWSQSWAQWMNGGTGGAVCTRTLNYSTARSSWVVN